MPSMKAREKLHMGRIKEVLLLLHFNRRFLEGMSHPVQSVARVQRLMPIFLLRNPGHLPFF